MVGMRSTRVLKPVPTLDFGLWTSAPVFDHTDHTDFGPISYRFWTDFLRNLCGRLADAYGRLGGRVRTDNPSVKCGYGRVDGSQRVDGG